MYDTITQSMAHLDVAHSMFIRNLLATNIILVLWSPHCGYVLSKLEDISTNPEDFDEKAMATVKSIMQEKYLAFLKEKDLLSSKSVGVIFAKVCL